MVWLLKLMGVFCSWVHLILSFILLILLLSNPEVICLFYFLLLCISIWGLSSISSAVSQLSRERAINTERDSIVVNKFMQSKLFFGFKYGSLGGWRPSIGHPKKAVKVCEVYKEKQDVCNKSVITDGIYNELLFLPSWNPGLMVLLGIL